MVQVQDAMFRKISRSLEFKHEIRDQGYRISVRLSPLIEILIVFFFFFFFLIDTADIFKYLLHEQSP